MWYEILERGTTDPSVINLDCKMVPLSFLCLYPSLATKYRTTNRRGPGKSSEFTKRSGRFEISHSSPEVSTVMTCSGFGACCHGSIASLNHLDIEITDDRTLFIDLNLLTVWLKVSQVQRTLMLTCHSSLLFGYGHDVMLVGLSSRSFEDEREVVMRASRFLRPKTVYLNISSSHDDVHKTILSLHSVITIFTTSTQRPPNFNKNITLLPKDPTKPVSPSRSLLWISHNSQTEYDLIGFGRD